ncbi:hypothetical protein N1851_004683 [Merluccius polli]|uniref:Uncharacterized protein n=1 Tax=Merluccius polli TaxID=89951 RepID=A0AA47P7B2_MERPO|nr:hypothetical protein N1851_004683 [Merluccius polli]
MVATLAALWLLLIRCNSLLHSKEHHTALASVLASALASVLASVLASDLASALASVLATALASVLASVLASALASVLASVLASALASVLASVLASDLASALASVLATALASVLASVLASALASVLASALASVLASALASVLASALASVHSEELQDCHAAPRLGARSSLYLQLPLLVVDQPPLVGLTLLMQPLVGLTLLMQPLVGLTLLMQPLVGLTLLMQPLVGLTLLMQPLVGLTLLMQPLVGLTLLMQPLVGLTLLMQPLVGLTLLMLLSQLPLTSDLCPLTPDPWMHSHATPFCGRFPGNPLVTLLRLGPETPVLHEMRGKEGRREGGKEGRRDGGTEGRRDRGKEGRRDGDERRHSGASSGPGCMTIKTTGNQGSDQDYQDHWEPGLRPGLSRPLGTGAQTRTIKTTGNRGSVISRMDRSTCSLLLLTFALDSVCGSNRFFISAPKVFHVNVKEKVFVQTSSVTTLYLEDESSGRIVSDVQKTSPSHNGKVQTVELMIDKNKISLEEFRSQPYLLLVAETPERRMSRVLVSVHRGYIFIQTNQPIYKPSDKGQGAEH